MAKPYNVNSAAEYMDCSPQAVRMWIKQGRLKCGRAGRLIRITQEQCDSFMNRNTRDEEDEAEGNDSPSLN